VYRGKIEGNLKSVMIGNNHYKYLEFWWNWEAISSHMFAHLEDIHHARILQLDHTICLHRPTREVEWRKNLSWHHPAELNKRKGETRFCERYRMDN